MKYEKERENLKKKRGDIDKVLINLNPLISHQIMLYCTVKVNVSSLL